MAGATARLDLMTVADLAGLSKQEIQGRTISEAVAAREQREARERERTQARKVAIATATTSLFRSKLVWVQAGAAFVLPVKDGVIRLEPEASGGTWRVERALRQSGRSVVAQGLSLEYAQGLGEDQVRQLGADHLAQADAPWREKPASERQLSLLRQWGIPIPPDPTRGWASNEITKRLADQPARSASGRKRGRRR